MSISINKKPKQVDFSGNGLNYVVKGNNYVISDSCKARFAFRKIGVLSVDDFFSLPIPDDFSGNRIVISAQLPVENSLEITAAETIDNTAAELSLIPKISYYYKVWVENDLLYFEYKFAAGVDLALLGFNGIGYESYLEDNSLLEQYCLSKEVEPNYFISAVVEYQNVKIAKLVGQVNESGITNFNIGHLLKRNLWNIGIVNTSFYKNNVSLNLTVKFSEHYKNQDWPFSIHDCIALPGKIDFAKYPDYELQAGFLTNRKKIETHERAFLKFAYFSGPELLLPVEFFVKKYYRDGTVSTESLHYFEVHQENQIYFADILVPEITKREDIYRFDIFSSLSSDTVNVYLYEKSFQSKQFAFRNNFGMWEMLTAIAFSEQTLKVNRDMAKRYVPAEYSSQEGEYSSHTYESHIEIKCGTGSLSKVDAATLFDMIKTNEFYELIDDKFIKCEMITDNVTLLDEADNLSNIEFSYRRSYDL